MSARVAKSLKLNLYQRSQHTERNPAWITIDIPHGLPWIKTVPVFERSHGRSMPMILVNSLKFHSKKLFFAIKIRVSTWS